VLLVKTRISSLRVTFHGSNEALPRFRLSVFQELDLTCKISEYFLPIFMLMLEKNKICINDKFTHKI
jgi:hypothetical protein